MAQQRVSIKKAYDNTVCNFNNLMDGKITPDNAQYISENILRVQDMIRMQGYTVGDINHRRLGKLLRMYDHVWNFMRTGTVATERFSSNV
ncbi:MAG: hypothetical protein NC548_45040 [Lachnospiraceae bacterium]|nr:hypothetical protein [Lachnospiraceae bacterium]